MSRQWSAATVSLAVLVSGCSFNDDGVPLLGDAGLGADARMFDGAIGEDASPADADTRPDAMPPIDAMPPDILHVRTQEETFGTAPLTLANVVVNTTDLTIDGDSPGAGITFESAPQDGGGPELAILHVSSFTVGFGATVVVRGDRPLVVIASGNVIISGTINAAAEGSTPGAGGEDTATGIGAGGDGEHQGGSFRDSGGGGAGYGTAGIRGGHSLCETPCTGNSATGGTAGVAYGDAPITILRGGSGGGTGGAQCSQTRLGGAGGGVIQLYSATQITIASGGGINAGGGGGSGGEACAGNASAGSGGGSGGSIFLQAPTVTVEGKLAANGGGGGGGASTAGGDAKDGDDGQLSDTPAIGGDPTGSGGAGGAGGAGTTAPVAGGDNSTQGNGGGGGGAVGRIAIFTQQGASGGGTVSPAAHMGSY